MIEVRRKRHENELHEKYMQLYHNEQCYEELMQSLEEAYQNRPAELRRLDNKREKEPNWYRNRNMLGITMYPKLFAGGLNGVIEHLDYLSEQKITYLHLMPLLKMPHPYNDGGYAVEDFKQVDPEIGTNEELEKLTKELRKRGISLCLDVVMNHTADSGRCEPREANRNIWIAISAMRREKFRINLKRQCRRCFRKLLREISHGVK